MKKYQIIYADPPWQFGGIRSSKKINGKYQYYKPDNTVGAGRYKTQTNEWIKNLGVRRIADKDCILFLWICEISLPIALEVIESWGFRYINIAFIWNKKEISGKQVCFYGGWTMRGSELCLLATKGKIHSKIKSHKVRQLVEAYRNKKYHSRKPDEVRNRIVELMGNLPRIELFAREKTDGWDVWGNEVESNIDLIEEKK